MMCWHAENDYLQLLAETGVVGVVVYGVVLFCVLRALVPFCLSARLAEPEYVFGAVAALVCFGVNALFEFVGQITANLVLAATLVGLVLGSRDPALTPIAPGPPSLRRIAWNHLVAVALALCAVLQGLAYWHWRQAGRVQEPARAAGLIAQSLRLWPWASNRQMGLTRQHVLLARDVPTSDRAAVGRDIRARLNRTLASDPFNWELRLERAWLDLAFAPDSRLAQAEAHEVTRLNPLQPHIPLRFARHFATRQPEAAYAFLQTAVRANPGVLREALAIAWPIAQDTRRLWALTPGTPQGLSVLGDFAVEQQLYPLAAQAYLFLTNRAPPVQLAERFLAARRPDLSLAQLERAEPGEPTQHLLCRAHFASGHYSEVIRLVTAMVEESPWRGEIQRVRPTGLDLAALKADWERQPTEVARAHRLADQIAALPARGRDLATLRQLADRLPQDPHLLWLRFQAEKDLNLSREAAETGLRLAATLMARPPL
jgi:hypothetical protein